VVDLHGRLDDVVCLGCGERRSRAALQDEITDANPAWRAVAAPAPDGDADIDAAAVEAFVPPRCGRCGGLLKPDVVFFGENVPVERYEAAKAALADADALLVAGSSLMVYSGFRFVRQAHEAGLPIAIVNRGRTRGDDLASLKVEGDESRVMVKEYQLDPVTHQLLHADFYQLAMDKAITVTVPIVLKGEPKGVKLQGGLLDFVTRDIQVQCLPTDIPEHIDVDVTELMLNQSIRLREIAENPKWKPVTDVDTMIVHVVMPKAEESAASAEAAAAPAEPEVAKKGKPEEKDDKK